jgi:hypothetical protein
MNEWISDQTNIYLNGITRILDIKGSKLSCIIYWEEIGQILSLDQNEKHRVNNKALCR